MARKTDIVLPAAQRKQIADLVHEVGEPAATAKLKVNRSTLARALAGLPIQRATRDMLVIRLEELKS